MENLEKAILEVFDYFSFFSYPVTIEEIHSFLPIKTTRKALKTNLDELVKSKKIIYKKFRNLKLKIKNYGIYTLPGHRIFFKKRIDRTIISQKKFKIALPLIKILSRFSQIKLIGLSGSMALDFARGTDDIDFFVIAAKGRLFTGRLICLLIAQLMGRRRGRLSKKNTDKVCFNLLFDKRDIIVPSHKHNLYTAHEVIQMKPLVAKGDIYQRFIKANQWVFDYFPNALNWKVEISRSKLEVESGKWKIVGDIIESFLKSIQLFFIIRHKTSEIITSTQLWFHPRDFEHRLRREGIVRG